VKLHPANTAGNIVTGYGPGYVAVNRVRYEHSLVVLPNRIITDWNADLDIQTKSESIALLTTLGADILLIGTGEALRFPPAQALRPLIDAKVGFEVMDTNAACRTYNILMAENRKVAAALILP
jgi:uncharacterized protein